MGTSFYGPTSMGTSSMGTTTMDSNGIGPYGHRFHACDRADRRYARFPDQRLQLRVASDPARKFHDGSHAPYDGGRSWGMGNSTTVIDDAARPAPSAEMATTMMRQPGSSLRTITEYLRASDIGTGPTITAPGLNGHDSGGKARQNGATAHDDSGPFKMAQHKNHPLHRRIDGRRAADHGDTAPYRRGRAQHKRTKVGWSGRHLPLHYAG